MAPTGYSATSVGRTRPRNRRQLILGAAGEVFAERGYHGASMEEIAARVEISAAALYRHFANKYVLFAECAHLMVDGLLETLERLDPAADLDATLRALAGTTVDHRATGGVYRWEARFLQAEDRRQLRLKFNRLVAAVATRVPSPESSDATLRAVAALGAIGSVTQHRTPLARARMLNLLVGAGQRAATPVNATPVNADLGIPVKDLAMAMPLPGLTDHLVRTHRRDQILASAISLFAAHGFYEVSTSQIASAAGLTTSGIYRHYPTKAHILAAGCMRAAQQLQLAAHQSIARHQTPPERVRALAAAFVAYSFENTELISVAEGEIVGLPTELLGPVLAAQREHVAHWEQELAQVRPELDSRQLRSLVHAGFGTATEAGRHLKWRDSAANRAQVTAALLRTLGC